MGELRIGGRWLAGFLGVALLAPMPAMAFETLANLLRAVPEAASDAPEFTFTAPQLQAGWPVMSLQGVGVDELNRALVDRQLGIDTVGIPFTDLDAVLWFGAPPETTVYLAGDAVVATDVRTALLARPDMTEGTEGGFAIFATGGDYEVFPARAEPEYPFGAGWRAYRVALRNGLAAVAYASPVLSRAIDAIEAADGTILERTFATMVEAAATLVPAGFEAYAASGIPAAAFPLRSETGLVPEYGMVIASTGTDWEATQFLLLFEDEEAAAAGAAALANILTALREWPELAKVEIGTAALPDAAVAVITVLFPPHAADHPSSALLNRWRNDAYSRRLVLETP